MPQIKDCFGRKYTERAAHNLFECVEQPGVTIWRQHLQIFKQRGASKNNEAPGIVAVKCSIPVTTEAERFDLQDDMESLGTALSLRKPGANSTAILWDKLNPGFLERSCESFSGFGPTTDVSLSRL